MSDPALLDELRDFQRERRIAYARAGHLVWMDFEEAAAYINYPQSTFNALAAKGKIPRHKRGAGWRYHRDELDEWLKAS